MTGPMAGSSGGATGRQRVPIWSRTLDPAPAAHTQLMIALDFALGPSYEVAVVGIPNTEETEDVLNTLKRKFIPNKIILFKPSDEEDPEITNIAEFTRHLSSKDDKTTAYVCRNNKCDLPTTSIEKMLRLLDATT